MVTEWNSLFPPFKPEKAISKRKHNDNRSPSSRDPRWPPGRRRKSSTSAEEEEEPEEGVDRGRRAEPPAGASGASGLLELLIFLVLIASTRAICPSKCVCNDKLLKAVCEYSNLEVVPIQLNPDVRHLKLNNNKIGSVHLTFIFYKNLVELDLSQNKIKSLGSKNFEFQMNLIKLNVSRNSIKVLHKDSFKGLSKLSVLDLSGNQIEEINERMSFKDLHGLQELDLSKNDIYAIETGVFDYLVNLRRLVLSENQLMKVPENAVNTLDRLVEIDLDSNLIDELPPLASMKNLEVLKVRSNLIGSLANETFDNLPRLKRLDLSDNNFTRISGHQFSRLTHLEHLNLSSNLFETLGPDSFRNLYKLREIYVDGGTTFSRIDSKAFAENVNLNFVSLSNNPNLRRLPKFLFVDKPNLKHVRISGNDFSTLDASDLPLDQLETLALGRNPFTCNCSLRWLWILKERQTFRNCTCSDASCYEACVENAPKSEKLLDYGSEEEEEDAAAASDSEEEEEAKEKNSRFRGFAYDKDVFPVILDLDEIYCEGRPNSQRILFRHAPESDFDCTATWIVVLAAAVLALLFVFLLTAFVYVAAIRCRRKTKNPVENFINAAKNYEDTHHTYYRYGESLQNGDVFEVLKSAGGRKPAFEKTNMYIKSPMDRPYGYPRDVDPRLPLPEKPCRKQSGRLREFYVDSPVRSYVSDANIYQEPFASPAVAKSQRPPHIVYV